MARISFSVLLLLLSFKFLIQTSRASWVPRGRSGAWSIGISRDASSTTTLESVPPVSSLSAKLATQISLRDSAIRLLAREDLSIGKRAPGSDRNDALKEIQQQLSSINDTISHLVALLSSLVPQYPLTSASISPSVISNSAQNTASTAYTTTTATNGANTSPASSLISATTSSSSSVLPATSGTVSASAPVTTSGYTFNPMAKSNVAVYYGQTDQSANVGLPAICNDPNVDIVILAFVNKLSTGPSNLPGLNLGPKCWGPTTAQISAGGAALVDCVTNGFSEEAKTCQARGKKILLSVGGAKDYSETTIASDQDATRIADNIWMLFGPPTAGNQTLMTLRPFGDFVFDGFDIDNESGSTEHWPTLISTLRSHFLASPGKPYYLGAAPQCPRPDASIPLVSMCTTIDFIFIQFYNNPSCNLNPVDSSGFLNSLKAWSRDVSDSPSFISTGNGVTSPRVFVGAPAFPAAANAGGFVGMPGFTNLMQDVKTAAEAGQIPNLGGVMVWDGAYGELSARLGGEPGTTGGTGKTWMQLAKEKLS